MAIDVRDSRRLLGPNLLWDRSGAGLDVLGPDRELDTFLHCWREEARRMLDALGWTNEQLAVRRFPGHAYLAISAPVDAARSASEVTREATRSALSRLSGEAAVDRELRVERLARLIAQERNPTLRHLRGVAERQGVTFLIDDDSVSVGLGRGSLTFPLCEVPEPEAIDWVPIEDVPSALITGSHGKTTVIRMLRAIAEAAEFEVGSCTNEESLAAGELFGSGSPASNEVLHRVLRDPRIDMALLEVPGSRLCERGLPIQHARAALVTRVAPGTVPAEGVVSRALDEYGLLVLNAESPASELPAGVPIGWFARDNRLLPAVDEAALGAGCLWLEGTEIRWSHDGMVETVIDTVRLPVALGGAAAHNVLNTMGAIFVATQLDISVRDIAKGLQAFTSSSNPGRCELITQTNGRRVLLDQPSDAISLEALAETARRLPADRRLWVVGSHLGKVSEAPSKESLSADWLGIAGDELDSVALAKQTLLDAKPDDLLIWTGDSESLSELRPLIESAE